MGEATQSRGGFVTDMTMTTGVAASGCCGESGTTGAPAAGQTQTVLPVVSASACCGEPVAVSEPDEPEQAASGTSCCGEPVAVSEPASQQASSCCG